MSLERIIDWALRIGEVVGYIYSFIGAVVIPNAFDLSDPRVLTAWAILLVLAAGFSGYRIHKHLFDAEVAKAEAVKRAEFEEAEKQRIAKIRGKFNSINLKQAMNITLIASEYNGLLTSWAGDVYKSMASRHDIIAAHDAGNRNVRLHLTPEWYMLMNEHGDMFHEIWARQIADYNAGNR